MKKPLVMLLAGGGGTRLGVLVKQRAKPAVPFAGRYRIIDFALTNVMHAQLPWVGVLTQYKPLSLMEHMGVGEAWNLQGRSRGVRILPPRTGEADSDWYQGTADAIWQNVDFMDSMAPERVVILSGDHIYRMDYRRMVEEHVERGAALSIAVMEVAPEDTSRFGMLWTDARGRITRFEEKPKAADTRLASMGIYVFEYPALVKALQDIVATKQGNDFGAHIMPALLAGGNVYAHRFDGYWRDVGTVSSYFHASMDCLDASSGLDLEGWEVCSRQETLRDGDMPPVRFGARAEVGKARLSAGCWIEGRVQGSVLSPGVQVGPGAVVEEAVLMDGAVIRPGARVRRAILDKGVVVGAGAVLDGGRDEVTNKEYAKCQMDGMVVVGKGSRIPEGCRVGSNTVLEAGLQEADFPGDLPDGATLVRRAHP
ncbi:MAG TPA: sugar phosphate nucleotidyltransferase [Myxococcota bacterium]|nr:sugar phosphate nucleotidyltransferase [Myxococcota bacterium]HRY94835.1 sugar phosphate nucleotidyltransferase [Myxococcota bacterium]HRZ83577.1 sugar phosphate nucleotidyltransferase [Candidatus Hydrogenedentota bacterium]